MMCARLRNWRGLIKVWMKKYMIIWDNKIILIVRLILFMLMQKENFEIFFDNKV